MEIHKKAWSLTFRGPFLSPVDTSSHCSLYLYPFLRLFHCHLFLCPALKCCPCRQDSVPVSFLLCWRKSLYWSLTIFLTYESGFRIVFRYLYLKLPRALTFHCLKMSSLSCYALPPMPPILVFLVYSKKIIFAKSLRQETEWIPLTSPFFLLTMVCEPYRNYFLNISLVSLPLPLVRSSLFSSDHKNSIPNVSCLLFLVHIPQYCWNYLLKT